ncbi:MAG TPA: DUF1127 domain-containing protein [Psychromonas sp.]
MLWVNTANTIKRAAFYYTTRRQLVSLSAEQLKDLAITREDAKNEAGKSSITAVVKALFAERQNSKKELQHSNKSGRS